MQDKVTYEFAVIRVVPKVEREEFLNVGVILFSKTKRYLQMKYHLPAKKLMAFSPDLDIADLEGYLNAWEQVCTGRPQGGAIGELDTASRYRWLTATRSTIIQSSRTHPGLCTDPSEVLEKLFDLYVA
ncbi:MAG: DUF3037 domain-containing protein [Bacteroidota bacterium]